MFGQILPLLEIDGSQFSLVDLSAPVLLGMAVLMIFRGWLVPGRYYDDALKENTLLRQTVITNQETLIALSQQELDAILEVGASVQAVMTAIDAVRTNPQGGGSHVGPR